VLLLFTDASRTDLNVLRSIRNLPVRLLTTGMLLTIMLGTVAAQIVFPHLSIWEAGILAAILAPTDAGLGQIIVNSPRVPMRIRQALNVEAGLNDGLSVPFLLFFIALAADTGGHSASLTQFLVEQLGFGVLAGVGIGLVGGWLFGLARHKEWTTESFQQTGVVTLPLLCLMVSEAIGASMFIAAFVAGLAVQIGFEEVSKHSVEFAEQWGQLFNLSVFFLFGLLAARDWQQFSLASVLYAILSLTVVRMLPVAIALIGTGLSRASVVYRTAYCGRPDYPRHHHRAHGDRAACNPYCWSATREQTWSKAHPAPICGHDVDRFATYECPYDRSRLVGDRARGATRSRAA
jgi:NhaP-type Na+/H+ or K+/H+ antiporter